MGQKFAKVIIDISHESVDRTFDYRIPAELEGRIEAGTPVVIPFGKGDSMRRGYVVEVTDHPDYEGGRIKAVAEIAGEGVSAEAQLIQLAWWMKEQYGSTMNQALKTVLPVRQKVRSKEKRLIRCLLDAGELQKAISEAERRSYRARARILRAFEENPVIPYKVAVGQMNVSFSTIKPLLEKGIAALESKSVYRNPVRDTGKSRDRVSLNEKQRAAVDCFSEEYEAGKREAYLIHGITGSGKTEVYMELISVVLRAGKQVIVLIPEIALTYQTVMRFYGRFGDRVSMINSRLSAGERYDQFERAKAGNVDIMIGPRSALFTPFTDLGLIIIDEEHEGAYKSEVAPRYHAREVAVRRAGVNRASVVLGSATPSLEAYTKALNGEYRLLRLDVRARTESRLAEVEIVDLREEMRAGNKSVFSRELRQKTGECLGRGEQVMFFINRRGYANFVSCRSCGEAVRCPHCDVTLTLHNNGNLVCHYCGHTEAMPGRCPSCGSPYIANFGVGTQKVEAMAGRMFPQARILRMDSDTTSRKGGYEEILTAFAEGEADILIGTQMIVKGHDFPNVTLVGILAADLSLYTPDYRSAERTFELLTQAAGRAGRGQKPGKVVIQTYSPEHYSIVTAAAQDYGEFYRQEMAYRSLMRYPPACQLLTIQLSSQYEDRLNRAAGDLGNAAALLAADFQAQTIGPVEASIYKVNDIYRKILYIKHENYDILIKIRNQAEAHMTGEAGLFKGVLVQYDFL